MFGCSDVYHWLGRTAKAVLLAGLRKSHNLDAMAGESIPMRVLVADRGATSPAAALSQLIALISGFWCEMPAGFSNSS
jgi:hypothetical protein